MSSRSTSFRVRRLVAALLAVFALHATEHHGTVKSGGLPVPGATITATQGERKLTTTTDEYGYYSFPDLSDGVWHLQIEMFGFAPLSEDVGIMPGAPSPEWELKLLPLSALKQSAPAAKPTPTSPVPAQPGAPPASADDARGRNFPGRAYGRGGAQQAGQQPGARPSLNQALNQNGFQRLGVNATGDGALDGIQAGAQAGADGAVDGFAAGDQNQNAALSGAALTVNGSVSSGIDAPQRNDWFGFGPGGLAGIGFGPGGPGGPGAPGAPGGPGGPQGQALAQAGPGPGGPGGGGRFGGGGFGGGRGGFGGGRGFGGPGGRQRNPNFRGRNPNAFGNGRRNRRSQYTGNLALILDNSALDAKPFSLTGQETPKAAYDQFRSTGTFGGPLKIPHLLSGQKTFFNINYQLMRSRNGSVRTGLVPTEAEREGNFSQLTTTLPAPFVNNIISQSQINQQALALLTLYPLPNFSGSNRYNYQIPVTSLGNRSNINSRVTETLNSNNQLAGNFAWQSSTSTTPNLFDFIDTTRMTGWNAGLLWSHHFTTRLISNLRYQFSRSATNVVPYFANLTNVSGQAGITGNDQSPQFWGPPTLSFSSGVTQLSDGIYSLNHNNTNAVTESVLWVRNKHNLTFGTDFRRLDFNQLSQQNPRGTLTFTGGYTGNALADFVLGVPDTIAIAYGNADKYFRESWADTFVTDDWRINSRVSLNIGVRWDFQGPVTELQNRLVNLAPRQDFMSVTPVCGVAAAGCISAAQAGYPDSLVRPNYHEIQPRIGLAWRPFEKSSTVVRAGYGIYYNTSVYQALASQMAQQAPLSYSFTQPNTLANPYTLTNAFLIPPTTAATQTFALDPNFQIGYLHYWQVSIQHNLTSSLVATLTYNGDIGLHQVQMFLPWSIPPGGQPSPYPSGYIYETSNGKAEYNAFSAQLQRRFRAGFSFNAVYTFSKAMDDAQSLGGRGATAAPLAQNWQDLAAEWSLSPFNRTHQLNFTTQWSTGQGLGGGALVNGWKGALFKNWTFMSTLQVASGLPLTPTVGGLVVTGTGISNAVRADLTGAPIYAAPAGLFLNPSAFAAPLSGQWGNAGRDIITGPILFSLNG
ncbi:MAG TPA: carboxypeptidase regulatory-like domain-containing protein, partial [Bryobacteraceae bacterium]